MISRNKLRVLLVAEESAGLQALKLLLDSTYELTGVLASPTHESRTATVWDAAHKADVPVWPAECVRDDQFATRISDLQVDLLLNVHSLYLIRGSILSACRIGAYNLHPGPLPDYAGLNVPSWAIYNGETEHAVTLHEMTAEIDAGTIAYSAGFPIESRDNGFSLTAKCIRSGLPLIGQLLQDASHERETGAATIPRIPQDFSKRQYFSKEAPNNGQLDWYRPAQDVVNHVRASDYSPFVSPWGAPETSLLGDSFGVVKVAGTGEPCSGVTPGTVGETTAEGVLVAAMDEWIEVRRVKVDDQVVAARDVLSKNDLLEPLPAGFVPC